MSIRIVGLGLLLLVAACGDGSGDDEAELTSCPRLGDAEVSCRFDGLWSDRSGEPVEASARVTTPPSNSIHLSMRRKRHTTLSISGSAAVTDTTYVGAARVYDPPDWIAPATIEVALNEQGTALRLRVTEGPWAGSSFDGVFVGE